MQPRLLGLAMAVVLAMPATAAAAEVKRDPNGVTGISPYNEDLAKGRAATQKGDPAGAIRHFDAAIAKDDRLLGHLLKAQAQLLGGDRDAAIQTLEAARSKEGSEAEQAKCELLRADLAERSAAPYSDAAPSEGSLKEALATKWDAVKTLWKAYAAYVAEHTRVPNYQATASERLEKIDARVQRDKDYGEVKVRIAKEAGPGS